MPSPGYWYDAWSIAAAQQTPAEWQKADSLGGRGRRNGGLQPPDHAPASPAKSGCCLEAGPLPRRPGPALVLSAKNFGLKKLRLWATHPRLGTLSGRSSQPGPRKPPSGTAPSVPGWPAGKGPAGSNTEIGYCWKTTTRVHVRAYVCVHVHACPCMCVCFLVGAIVCLQGWA